MKTDTVPREARLLLTRLEHQHASATPQQWDELKEEMFSALNNLPTVRAHPNAAAGAAALSQEFDKVRVRALAKRRTRLVQESLRDGLAQPAQRLGRFEQVDVPCGEGKTLPLVIPAEDLDDPAAALARTAALAGVCRKCSARATADDVEVTMTHKRRCPASAFATA